MCACRKSPSEVKLLWRLGNLEQHQHDNPVGVSLAGDVLLPALGCPGLFLLGHAGQLIICMKTRTRIVRLHVCSKWVQITALLGRYGCSTAHGIQPHG